MLKMQPADPAVPQGGRTPMPAMPSAQSDEPTGTGLPLLYNLVYCSRAVHAMDEAEIAKIIEAAHRHNPRRGITGLLTFGSGIFFQWLEGPRDNVTALMSTLRRDPRHDTVVTLSESEEVRERVFPQWDMEFVDGADVRDVLLDAIDTADDAGQLEALRLLLARLEAGGLPEQSA
jgi:hypothetical protein